MRKNRFGGEIIGIFLSAIIGVIFGICWMAKKCEQELIDKEEMVRKNAVGMKSAYKWISAIQGNRHIDDYLRENNINSVAIYGLGELGRILLKELENDGINIRCVIDRDKNTKSYGYQLFTPNDDLPQIDAVIVTPVFYFTDIAEQLRKHTDASIVSLDDIW